MQQKRGVTTGAGFTLIELLIVVAIIAILAAIAVPNFLEAQTRSKVARVKSDQRTIQTAIEAYAVDWNKTPADYVVQPITRVDGSQASAEGFISPRFSTPVAYLTSGNVQDTFLNAEATNLPNGSVYFNLFYQSVYHSSRAGGGLTVGEYARQTPAVAYNSIKSSAGWSNGDDRWTVRYGAYKLGSLGPDRDYDGGASIDAQYDPTNGSVSSGDIYRTQLASENVYRKWP